MKPPPFKQQGKITAPNAEVIHVRILASDHLRVFVKQLRSEQPTVFPAQSDVATLAIAHFLRMLRHACASCETSRNQTR